MHSWTKKRLRNWAVYSFSLRTFPDGQPQPGLHTAGQTTLGLSHVAGQGLQAWKTWPLIGQEGPHALWQAVREGNLKWLKWEGKVTLELCNMMVLSFQQTICLIQVFCYCFTICTSYHDSVCLYLVLLYPFCKWISLPYTWNKVSNALLACILDEIAWELYIVHNKGDTPVCIALAPSIVERFTSARRGVEEVWSNES